MSYKFTASERFLRYVTVDTQSDHHSTTSPSTEKQTVLSHLLYKELRELGLQEVEINQYGHVFATIPSNSLKKVPVICLCAHVDTAPDCSGTGVKPIVHRSYQGTEIVLPDDPTQVISPHEYPILHKMMGHDLITASGTTLLGSDDKAGIAEIVDLANYLVTHPDVPHGKIRILFTTDEEVGRGTENLDIGLLGAHYGYTLDGGRLGTIEDQSFSANGVTVTIRGVSAHPGYAKHKMVNALKIAGEILSSLPRDTLSPESTEDREGFIHPVSVSGNAELCTMSFIVRDFDSAELTTKQDLLEEIISKVLMDYPKASFDFSVKEQYRNMKSVLDLHPYVVNNAIEAVTRVGLEPKLQSIRGGTDGSKLSFLGLPCANLFSGQNAIHSKHEFISIQEMEIVVKMLIELVTVWHERA